MLSLFYNQEPISNDESSVNTEQTVDIAEKEEDWNPNYSDSSLGASLPKISCFPRRTSYAIQSNHSRSSISLASSSSSTLDPLPILSKKKGKVVPVSEGSAVSFYTRVQTSRTSRTLSEEEIDATWYTYDEMQCLRKDAIRTLRLMFGEDLQEETDEEVCFRGLEYKSGLPSKARKERKKNARNVVLEEQDFHREICIIDAEAIAAVSRECSQPCVLAAIKAAEMDLNSSYEEWKLHFDEEQCLYSNKRGRRNARGCWRSISTNRRHTIDF